MRQRGGAIPQRSATRNRPGKAQRLSLNFARAVCCQASTSGCAHSDSVDELEACVVKLALGLQMRTWMCDSTDELEEAP